jgi:DNA-binding NtrC family response regulator
VKDGRFREDLYHRLSVTSIHIPPLRERREDILPLIHFFVNRYRNTAPRPISGITRAFLKKLLSYEWPGNIRELENIIRSALALSKTEHLTTLELKELGERSRPGEKTDISETLASVLIPALRAAVERKDKEVYETIHREVDRTVLAYVMTYTRENQSRAARLLGINRLTLRKKLGGLR